MKVFRICGCLLLLAVLLNLTSCDWIERTFFRKTNATPTPMPVSITNCQPGTDPIISSPAGPVSWTFSNNQNFTISFKPKYLNGNNITPPSTSIIYQAGGATWNMTGAREDCGDPTPGGGTGCSFGYSIQGASCTNDPIVHVTNNAIHRKPK